MRRYPGLFSLLSFVTFLKALWKEKNCHLLVAEFVSESIRFLADFCSHCVFQRKSALLFSATGALILILLGFSANVKYLR